MQKEKGSIKCKVNSILLKLDSVHFKIRKQIEPLQIDPHSERTKKFPGILICNKFDIGLKLIDSKCTIKVLKHLKKRPATLIPLTFIM